MEENNENNKITYYQVKFIIVGDASVGKTNIYYRFVNGNFLSEYDPTVVVDYYYQDIEIEDKLFSLQLWDTAGSEKYKSITKGYYTNSACCILVYDIEKEDSFESINNWINQVKLYSSNKIIFILVGNKYDLNETRKVSEIQGKTLALEYGMEFLEVSAKTGYNIDEIFNIACQKIYENINKGLYDDENKEGVKICSKYTSEFTQKKTFSLRTENNNNNMHYSIKKKKRKKCC